MVTTILPTLSVPTSSPTMGQERDTPVAILASAISVVLALIVVSILAMVAVIIKRKRIHKNTYPIQHPVDVTTSDGKVELQDNISCSTTEHVYVHYYIVTHSYLHNKETYKKRWQLPG